MSDNCIWIEADEQPSVFRTEIRTARKPWTCYECRETIPVGAKYEQTVGCWEGKWGTFRTCARCANVRNDFFRGWTFGEVVNDFKQAHGFDYRDGIPPDFAPCGKGE